MKKSENELRKHFVKTRMNDDEVNLLLKLQQRTTEKDTSSYLRKVALQKPVTVKCIILSILTTHSDDCDHHSGDVDHPLFL